MKILTVVGARPQFVKAAAVSLLLRQAHQEVLVHTGQHYDPELSEIFFDELGLPRPDEHLGVGSGTHGAQTGAILAALDPIVARERPDWVLVYGDTNSTLAGALCAAKLHVSVAHVEAGLRSGNWKMPEEINRTLADAAADLLLAPTQTAAANLAYEHVHGRIRWVGDVMLDIAMRFGPVAERRRTLADLGLEPGNYYAATVHRAENTDDPERLEAILTGLGRLSRPVALPLHPRTRKQLAAFGLVAGGNVRCIDPVGYLDMTALVRSARAVLTDSGGLQKEAAFHGVRCVTLRDETEWPETVEAGWNVVAGTSPAQIVAAAEGPPPADPWPMEDLHRLFGGGQAGRRVVEALEESALLARAGEVIGWN